ncbi:hypothetical protein JKG47_17285 [Acidithiobacillus sp. MC6.1]|nr:hypothetical protein [Acidithiobacillus sp. MC6.1]
MKKRYTAKDNDGNTLLIKKQTTNGHILCSPLDIPNKHIQVIDGEDRISLHLTNESDAKERYPNGYRADLTHQDLLSFFDLNKPLPDEQLFNLFDNIVFISEDENINAMYLFEIVKRFNIKYQWFLVISSGKGGRMP